VCKSIILHAVLIRFPAKTPLLGPAAYWIGLNYRIAPSFSRENAWHSETTPENMANGTDSEKRH